MSIFCSGDGMSHPSTCHRLLWLSPAMQLSFRLQMLAKVLVCSSWALSPRLPKSSCHGANREARGHSSLQTHFKLLLVSFQLTTSSPEQVTWLSQRSVWEWESRLDHSGKELQSHAESINSEPLRPVECLSLKGYRERVSVESNLQAQGSEEN